GLVRNDAFDWPAQLATLVPSVDPDISVAFFGGNDSQGFSTPLIQKIDSPEWRAEYAARVDQFIGLLGGPNRTVIWIGIPTHPGKANAGLAVQTEVVRERLAAHPEVHYVDLWSLFAGINGGFSKLSRDPFTGEYIEVRTKVGEDYFHLNTRGTKILASLVTNLIADDLVARGATQAADMKTALYPQDQPGLYEIVDNDNLTVIAKRVGTTIDAIVAVNGWADENHVIFAKQKIKLPAPPLVQPATAVASNEPDPSTTTPPTSTG
ncbi:MAG TPA: LysM peptidoglycan-binding domain-containing protein, partial [Ilumatobacteraceae bacterium]|nr:LysM peptidoglycan-binding domain-containing protein [Ilumatobacteraceae bacterium]